MCSSSFSSPSLPLVVVCRPPPPLSSSSLSYALFDCCVCFIFCRRCRRACRHRRHHRRRRHPSSVVMSPPPSASAIGCRLPSTAPPHTPCHGARARCWRRRRRLLPLERVVVVRGGVGVVAVPPPWSSSSDPLDGAILNALSRYAHTALALTPSSTPWASALLEGSASNASLRCSVRIGGDGE